MRFIIFVIDNQPNGSASGNEIEAIDAFNDSLQKNGQWITAAGINPSTKATLIDNRAGLNQVQAGHSLQVADYYCGFWIIEAEDEAKAIELATQGSRACNRKVEVRPYL